MLPSLKLEATTAYINPDALNFYLCLALLFDLKVEKNINLIIYNTFGLRLVHCDSVRENTKFLPRKSGHTLPMNDLQFALIFMKWFKLLIVFV